jgi:hypothetical protein
MLRMKVTKNMSLECGESLSRLRGLEHLQITYIDSAHQLPKFSALTSPTFLELKFDVEYEGPRKLADLGLLSSLKELSLRDFSGTAWEVCDQGDVYYQRRALHSAN